MRGYFTTAVSDNIEETPEGYLICKNCVIARTGWQNYKVSELNPEAARRVGIDTDNPGASIDLYRDEDDVFDSDFLRSLEGKAVTDNHPPDFVFPENFNEFARGHMQNVHAGRNEPLDNGDFPVLADIHITAEPLLSKVRNKMQRELSLGYDYSLRRDGNRVCQTNMVGNHVAVVPKGRAGPEARINDAAPEPNATADVQPITEPKQEITTVATEKKKLSLRHIFGLGIRTVAADASIDPEALADVAQQFHEEPAAQTGEEEQQRLPADAADRRPAADSRARARDARSQRLHDALDRALDQEAASARETPTSTTNSPSRGSDEAAADEELASMFGGSSESEDAEDDEEEESLGPIGEEEEENGEEEEHEGADRRPTNDRASAADSQATMRFLTRIKPIIAKGNDRALKVEFNRQLERASRGSRASDGGGHGRFAEAARSRGADAQESVVNGAAKQKKLQDYYNDSHKASATTRG